MAGATVMPIQRYVNLDTNALIAPGYLEWRVCPLLLLLIIIKNLSLTIRRGCMAFPTWLAQLKLKSLHQFRKA